MLKKICVIIISLVLFYSCNSDERSIVESTDDSLSKLMIVVDTLPSDVDNIIGTLTNPNYDSITKEFTMLNDSAYCLFDEVSVGKWQLDISAYYQGELTYHGKSTTEVFRGNISYVNVYMKKANNVGMIYVGLTWENDQYQHFLYDFENNDLSDWGGPADAEIIEGELNLSSVQGYKYHWINYDGKADFVEGEIEIDIFPQNGKYTFEVKGNSISNNILEWGIFTQFRNDSIFVSQYDNNIGFQIFTKYMYEQNTWYTLRFKFNNELGEKGQFDFWITPRDQGGHETYLGNYNYVARQGKLKGVNVFALSSGDPEKTVSMEGRFDNIKFFVK